MHVKICYSKQALSVNRLYLAKFGAQLVLHHLLLLLFQSLHQGLHLRICLLVFLFQMRSFSLQRWVILFSRDWGLTDSGYNVIRRLVAFWRYAHTQILYY